MSTAGPTYGPLIGGYVPFSGPLGAGANAVPVTPSADFGAAANGLQPALLGALVELRGLAIKNGMNFRVESGYRSTEKQAALYAQRDTNPYPVAAPGTSLHEYGCAADLAITAHLGYSTPAAALAFLGGMLAPRVGLVWSPSDAVHFALPISLAEAKARYGGAPTGAGGSAQPLPTVVVTERAPTNYLWAALAVVSIALIAGD